MFAKIASVLWGKFDSKEELKKFGYLSFIFGLIIGTYWTLRPMKDGIFSAIIGIDYQPLAKMLSVLIVFPLVILYGKLIDTFPRNKVFYVLIAFYGIMALIFMWLFMNPELGIANTVKSPARLLGWFWYVYVESFGSLIVALFWAFTADTTSPDSARRGFPIIALFGQIGNILGPYFLDAKWLGFVNSAPIVGICGVLMFFTGILFWIMMHAVPKNQFIGYKGEEEDKETEPGFLEGLKLLLTKSYLLGIFFIVTIYEVIITIIDFHFKATASGYYPNEVELTAYLNSYAVWTGIVATACVLLGINNIQRRLGITTSLILLPFLIAFAIIMIKLNPEGLTVAFWIMVFSKAINYVLNQPTLKQLYIPTTKDTKYKAQAWSDMFGSRGSKAAGSAINLYRKTFVRKYGSAVGVSAFLTLTSMLSLGLIGIWLFAAWFVAKTYSKAIEEDQVVC